MQIVATRFKVSLSCNTTVDITMSSATAETLQSNIGALRECVQLNPDYRHVQVHVPSNQTCKKIGVQKYF